MQSVTFHGTGDIGVSDAAEPAILELVEAGRPLTQRLSLPQSGQGSLLMAEAHDGVVRVALTS